MNNYGKNFNFNNIEELQTLSAKTVSHLEKLGFKGSDRDLETSLFEYRYIYRETNEPNEIQVINYCPTVYDKFTVFNYGYFRESDVNEVLEQKEDEILSNLDMSKEDWLNQSVFQKFCDIESTFNWFDINQPCMNKGSLLKLKPFEPKETEIMDTNVLELVGGTYSDYTAYRD